MRRALIALAVAGLLGLTACGSLRPVVRWAITPRVGFDPSAVPPAPDYADPAAWSALPERQDAGDAVPEGLPAVAQSEAPVDVFYVHPTSHVGRAWNAPWDDPKLNADTDAVATGVQAPAFNACCAVYAPRYRQANGSAFYQPGPDGAAALRVAFEDVKRAFQAFQARRGPDRPFVLAGHSQGSVLGWMLLDEVIAGSPAQDRLVVAYLPGASIPTSGSVPPCATPDAVGCVVSWNAREPGYVDRGFEVRLPNDGPRLCTNPITWTDAPGTGSLGAVFLEDRDTSPRPGFASARCERGTLVVDARGHVRRSLPSRVLDRVMGPGNLHPMEFQLWFMDLRANVDVRIAAFQAR